MSFITSSLKRLNGVLGKYLGFEIVITGKGSSLKSKEKSVNHTFIIEFMGPSGVGKTTLRNYYLKQYSTSFTGGIITEKFLETHTLNLNEKDIENTEIYDILFYQKLLTLNQKRSNFVKTNRQVRLFYKTLAEDFIIRNYSHKKYAFLDQHIFKFFTENFLQLEDSETQKELLKNRIIVYCHAAPKTVVEYIKKRAASGKISFKHQGKNESQLYSTLTDHMANRKPQIQKLKEYGACIITINTENSLKENAKLLDDYLKSHLKNKNR